MHQADDYLERAAAATGLADFGDPGFREGLEVLVASIESEAELNDIGRLSAEAMLIGHLENRLRVVDYQKAHPELRDERIVRPIIIVGLPRSGTTALSHLLSVHPDNRSLHAFELGQSIPPVDGSRWREDSRYRTAAEGPDPMDALNPDFKAIHYDPPEMAIECIAVMGHHFVSSGFPTMFHVPAYVEWLLEVDHAGAYRWHKQFLQLLQSNWPGRWSLKTPHHSMALEALVAEYPDAQLVVTHRDPATCLASTASLTRGLSSTFSDARNEIAQGEYWKRMLTKKADGLVAYADTHGDDALIHVHYREFVQDPVAATRKIYEAMGEKLSPEAEANMETHVRGHKQHRFGRHRYEMSDFGLERTALHERFEGYIERFDVALEG